MTSDLRELWLSFIGAMIRFWDNRFSAKECFSCKILETELARKREENSNLVDRLLGSAFQPAEPEVADSKLETMHRATAVPWHIKKRELEMAHSSRHQKQEETRGSDLESFEKDLEELSK